MYICNSCNSFFEEPIVEGGCSERLGYELVDFCPECHSVDFKEITKKGERLVINREMHDTNVDLLKQVGKITMTDYLSDPDSCMEDMLGSALEELLAEYDNLTDEKDDLERKLEQYRHYEQF